MLEGVAWDSAEMCMHGLKDPVSHLPYKKSVSLLHNLDPGVMAPRVSLQERRNEELPYLSWGSA